MNTALIHLLWKEYRAQRTLWLALVAANILIALAVVLSLGPRGVDFEVLMGYGLVLMVAFGVASVTVAFAGEDDDGTALWIRVFPMSRRTLFAGKLLITLSGMLALLLIAVITTIALSLLFRVSDLQAIGTAVMKIYVPDWFRAAVGMLTFLLLSLLCSLRNRKIFFALGWAAAAMLSFAILCLNSKERALSPVPLLLSTATALAIVPSLRQWQIGPRSRPSADDTESAKTLPWPAWMRVLTVGRPDAWSRRLISAASQSPLLSRTIRVLLWRELRLAVPFLRLCLLISVSLLGCQIVFRSDPFPYLLCFLMLVVIESGLRAFRHDQQQLNGLFWSHRGVSPGLVYGIRCVVWLGTLSSIAAVAVFLELTVMNVFAHFLTDQQRLVFVSEFMELTPSAFSSYALNVAIGALAGGFAISQLLSCWIQKPLLAAFFAMVGSILYWMWLYQLELMQTPLLFTAWPLTVVFLAAAFLTRRQWMDRRSSGMIILQRTAWIVVPCLCLIPIHDFWRAYEIPEIPFLITSGDGPAESVSLESMSDAEANRLFERYGYSTANSTGPWSDVWNQLVASGAPAFLAEGTPDLNQTEPLQETQQARALAALDTILSFDLKTQRLPPDYRVPWARTPLPAGVTQILLADAQRLLQEGQPQEALSRTIQTIRLNRWLMMEATSWKHWRVAVNYQFLALKVLRRFSADHRLTDMQLEQAEQQLQDACAFWPVSYNILNNRTIVWQQILQRRGYLWDEYLRQKQYSEEPFEWLIQSNWANRRRAMNVILMLAALHSSSSPVDSTTAEMMYERYKTSVPWEIDLVMDPALRGGLQSFEERLFQSLLNDERATQLTLALQRYRRQHEQFPASLFELTALGIPASDPRLREVTENAMFDYAPQGIDRPLHVLDAFGEVRIIPASQPILFSQGPLSPLTPPTTEVKRQIKKGPIAEVEPDRVWFINGSTLMGLGPDVSFWQRNRPTPPAPTEGAPANAD